MVVGLLRRGIVVWVSQFVGIVALKVTGLSLHVH